MGTVNTVVVTPSVAAERPVAFQDVPAAALPAALRDDNPWQVSRRVHGVAA
jgi:hypothetical protein